MPYFWVCSSQYHLSCSTHNQPESTGQGKATALLCPTWQLYLAHQAPTMTVSAHLLQPSTYVYSWGWACTREKLNGGKGKEAAQRQHRPCGKPSRAQPTLQSHPVTDPETLCKLSFSNLSNEDEAATSHSVGWSDRMCLAPKSVVHCSSISSLLAATGPVLWLCL